MTMFLAGLTIGILLSIAVAMIFKGVDETELNNEERNEDE